LFLCLITTRTRVMEGRYSSRYSYCRHLRKLNCQSHASAALLQVKLQSVDMEQEDV
jgi:hypothetical protein